MLFFTNHAHLDPRLTLKVEVINPTHACRYLGVTIESKLNFENHLNSILINKADAIRSLNLLRNQIPLKVRVDLNFKSFVLSHLSVIVIFLQTLT